MRQGIFLPDYLFTDYSQEGGDEVRCAHCEDDIYCEELLEYDYEWRHVTTASKLSVDGSHEVEVVGI